MRKVAWGILSTSKFAARAIIPAVQKSELSSVEAIASRDEKKAKELAARLGIPRTVATYDELLEDPAIEVVYIPLPNHLHVDWTLRALKAGKNVLCEKPVGVNLADALRLANVGRDFPKLKVMEAFMYRHHPQWKKVKQLVEEKAIGELISIDTLYSYYNVDESNIRNIKDAGGGVMRDIGCYCTSLSRFLFGAEPWRVMGRVEYDPKTGVDRLSTGVLDFGGGLSTFTCSTQMQRYQRVNVLGRSGRIEIEIPFNAPNDRKCRIWLQRGDAIEEILFDVCDQYTIQADLFASAIISNGEVPTPIEDGIANMRVVDAVESSSATGSWIGF